MNNNKQHQKGLVSGYGNFGGGFSSVTIFTQKLLITKVGIEVHDVKNCDALKYY